MLVVTADVRLEAVNVGQRDDEEGDLWQQKTPARLLICWPRYSSVRLGTVRALLAWLTCLPLSFTRWQCAWLISPFTTAEVDSVQLCLKRVLLSRIFLNLSSTIHSCCVKFSIYIREMYILWKVAQQRGLTSNVDNITNNTSNVPTANQNDNWIGHFRVIKVKQRRPW